ncbi:MAG TPA: DUF4872 domain-containing protein, partial [Pseudolysinimonas sp.]|nr:DUF4872 domain-containing protein [Pseudolysinimonas sp.]
MDGPRTTPYRAVDTMTKQQSFKERVRARMAKTGERYTTARAQILGTMAREASPSNGHAFRPGLCRDTAAVTNVLAAAGVRLAPGGASVDEVLLTGLCGGTCFLYVVFEYKGWPPLPSVLMRFDTAADRFALQGLRRLGLGLEVSETSSAAKADRSLDEALDAGHAVLCVVGGSVPAEGAALDPVAAMAPMIVAVISREGDDYVVDSGSGRPERRSRAALAAARAGYKPAKRRMAVLRAPGEVGDAREALHGALADTAQRYEVAPYKGFASNFGLAGMQKFVDALTDTKDKRGWPRLFPEGKRAAIGLRRLYQGLELEMTPPAGGRGVQAQFLRAAAEHTGHRAYADVARGFDAAAAAWSEVSGFVAGCGVREVRMGC